MNGYFLTFYTQQDRSVHGQALGSWLVELAQSLDIQGATLIAGNEGFGHDKQLRSIHFFDLAGQPIEVSMALSSTEITRIFAALHKNQVNVFYTMTPIEYGMSNDFSDDAPVH